MHRNENCVAVIVDQTPSMARYPSEHLAQKFNVYGKVCLTGQSPNSEVILQAALALPEGACLICSIIFFCISFALGSALCVPTIHV